MPCLQTSCARRMHETRGKTRRLRVVTLYPRPVDAAGALVSRTSSGQLVVSCALISRIVGRRAGKVAGGEGCALTLCLPTNGYPFSVLRVGRRALTERFHEYDQSGVEF